MEQFKQSTQVLQKSLQQLLYYMDLFLPQRSFFIESLSSTYFLLNKFFCEQVDGDNVIPLPQLVSLGKAMKEYEIDKDNKCKG